jgi:hypothetical protein
MKRATILATVCALLSSSAIAALKPGAPAPGFKR